MALSLTKTLPSGATVSYLKISETQIHRNRGTCLVGVDLYVSQATRDAGLPPLDFCSVDVPVDVPLGTGALLPALYDYLKSLPAFTGAVDV